MNMKQSCKALICAIEGELDGRHCTEEQAAAILDHALPSLTEALARVEAAAKENLADERRATSFAHTLLAMAKSERDKAYSLLADVLYILDQHRTWTGMGWEQLPVPVHAVEKIRSKLAQAEQQDDGRTCRFCQKRFDSAGECGNHVDQFHHGEAEQQEAKPVAVEAQGAQAGNFWTWLDLAYRDGSKGEGRNFTKYNMEVAYRAGAEAARAALATQPAEWADQLYTQGFDAGAAASKRLNAVRGAEHDQ